MSKKSKVSHELTEEEVGLLEDIELDFPQFRLEPSVEVELHMGPVPIQRSVNVRWISRATGNLVGEVEFRDTPMTRERLLSGSPGITVTAVWDSCVIHTPYGYPEQKRSKDMFKTGRPKRPTPRKRGRVKSGKEKD